MKRKRFWLLLIPVVLILIILVFPMPVGILNDGGSRDYRALTYRLIRWNRFYVTESGEMNTYTKWSFYPYSLRNESVDELWESERSNVSSNAQQTNETESFRNLSYQVSYHSVGWDEMFFKAFREFYAANGDEGLPVAPITSSEELYRIFSLFDQFWAEEYEKITWVESGLYRKFSETYPDQFFQDNTLLLIYVEEGSGSYGHRIHDCYAADGKCTVIVETIVPEIGTCDMAGRILALSLEKQDVEGLDFSAYRYRK